MTIVKRLAFSDKTLQEMEEGEQVSLGGRSLSAAPIAPHELRGSEKRSSGELNASNRSLHSQQVRSIYLSCVRYKTRIPQSLQAALRNSGLYGSVYEVLVPDEDADVIP